MKVQHKVIDDINVFYLSGKLCLDSAESFQEVCYRHFLGQKAVFCLEGLNFVGSVGVTVLMQTFRRLYDNLSTPLKFSNVSSEYHKIFSANLPGIYEPYERLESAVLSYRTPVVPEPVPLYEAAFANSPLVADGHIVEENTISKNEMTTLKPEEHNSSEPKIERVQNGVDEPVVGVPTYPSESEGSVVE